MGAGSALMKYNDPILPRPPIFAYMISLIASERNRTVRRRGVTSPLPSLAYKHRHDRISVRSDPKAPVQFSGLSRTPCPCLYQRVIPGFITPETKPDSNRNSSYQSSTNEQNRTALLADAYGLEPQSKVLETLMLTIAPSIHMSDFPVSDEPIYTR